MRLFICHATTDQEAIVRPLADILRRRGVDVWYSEYSLGIGDPVLASIDKGIATADHGLIVFSPTFLGRSFPEHELTGLRQRFLASGGGHRLFPIYHDVDHADILRWYPPLADILALRSSDGPHLLVTAILGQLYPSDLEPPLMIACPETYTRVTGGLDSLGPEEEVLWFHCAIRNDSDRSQEDVRIEVESSEPELADLDGTFLQLRSAPPRTTVVLTPGDTAEFDVVHIQAREYMEGNVRLQLIRDQRRRFETLCRREDVWDNEAALTVWVTSTSFARRGRVSLSPQTGGDLSLYFEWLG